ncbi:MAG: cation:proton antiporter [Candidatus Nitrohelix vancouverensis]|uniref:Cation:proton antiporter n=1 Tax=Candidatus Nitrohelix vancouverensis TaxID=2705534 RepID=A0A7T0C099_9BACT|nr:MAG: cation:proton antiporter [Candidatus Nitrohelix vancouverensis]
MHGVTDSIEFQMSLLLFTALGGYQLASRIAQPAVVGVMLAGIVIGPSVLGWVVYTDFVQSIAHLGAIILLFVIGLEFDLKTIGNWRYAIIGLFGVLLPWAGGYFLAEAYGFESHKAIIIGVALTATSIAITADVFREMGKLHTEAARAIIGAAIIDDILALLALAVSKQIVASAISIGAISLMVLKAIVFLAAGIYLGRVFISKFVSRISASRQSIQSPEFLFIFTMMMAFLYAMCAELMGLSSIVGAFIAGVSFEGVTPEIRKHLKTGTEYLRIIFGAVFFISLGILADIQAFTWDTIGFLLALTLVAMATKLIGCGLPAKFLGMNNRDALAVGLGMAPRGEVAMIIALLALNDKIIEQPAYVSLVMMSLLTTLMVPLILRNWIYPKQQSGDAA